MRYPQFLPEHGTIGFVAPSFGCAPEPYYTAFLHALDGFHAMGYQTKLGPNCFAQEGIGISNTPQLCAEELCEMYLGADSDVILSCGGGELMCEVVPYIRFDDIAKAKPKWYMGFSDNTNFTFLSATLADTAAIYGPCASAFGMEPWHESITDAFELLCGKRREVHSYKLWEREWSKDENHPLLPYHVTEPVKLYAYPKEEADVTGRLIGGCIDCLVNLIGTDYDRVRAFCDTYQKDGFLWFLEACDLNIMSIRRALWHMKEAGWFSHVKGFLIGRPLCFGEEAFGIDQYRAVTDVLGEYGVPILMDLDIGHLSPMMPIVTGAIGTAHLHGGVFTMEMEWR